MRGKTIEDAMAGDFYDPKQVRNFVDMYRPPMEYKGFRRALISTLRAGVVENGIEVFRQLGQRKTPPVLLVWGEDDVTVPFKFSKVFVSLVPERNLIRSRTVGIFPIMSMLLESTQYSWSF